MANRATRRKLDLDARRGERKREFIPVHFIGKDWQFPVTPPMSAVDALERDKLGDAIRGFLGVEKGNELINDPAFDIEDANFLFEQVYGEEQLGESAASSGS